jgi:hypothetical protein
MAPPVEVVEDEDPDPHNSDAVTLGPEIAVCAGIVLPSGQVTDTPVLHGPTAVAVGVLCALTKVTVAAETTAAMKMISVRFLMFPLSSFESCQIFENLGGDKPDSGRAGIRVKVPAVLCLKLAQFFKWTALGISQALN